MPIDRNSSSLARRLSEVRSALRTDDDVRFVRAPGRVNLIGDHTDYEEGLCLPVALDLDTVIGFVPDAEAVEITSSGERVRLPVTTADTKVVTRPAWAPIVRAALEVLGDAGRPAVGMRAAVTSTVPVAAGLSSSAAFVVALALSLAHAARWPIEGRDLVLAAQRIEQRATGVPCGVLDQSAAVHGRAGHALLLDCRTLECDPIPLADTVEFVLVHSGAERRLATSEYAQRRDACARAARRIGVAALRDATPESVRDDPIARHVVAENRRVVEFAEAMRRQDASRMGTLMLESHRSLRDDFAVSTPEIDLLVDDLVAAGAYGARITGAGFGGCVVAAVPSGAGPQVAEAAIAELEARDGRATRWWPVRSADGAGPLTA